MQGWELGDRLALCRGRGAGRVVTLLAVLAGDRVTVRDRSGAVAVHPAAALRWLGRGRGRTPRRPAAAAGQEQFAWEDGDGR